MGRRIMTKYNKASEETKAKMRAAHVQSHQVMVGAIVTAGTQWGTQIQFQASGMAIWPTEEEYITLKEEQELRENNTFVKELYDEYRVALILAHGKD